MAKKSQVEKMKRKLKPSPSMRPSGRPLKRRAIMLPWPSCPATPARPATRTAVR